MTIVRPMLRPMLGRLVEPTLTTGVGDLLWFLATGVAADGRWEDSRPLDGWFLATGTADATGLWADARAI